MEANVTLTISFILYSLFIVGFGLYSTRLKKDTDDDFVLANRELGPWASSLSASASSESGWVMLGLVGEAYLFGMAAFWIVPGIAAGYLFNWFVIAERLRKDTLDSGAVTLPQYILGRFDPKSVALRVIPVIIITLSMVGYVAAQMNAAGKAFHATFDVSYEWGVLAGAVIILAYTITGGFRAIAWTDIIQAGFMFIALIIMPFVVLANLGGWEAFVSKVTAIDPGVMSFTYHKTGFALFGFVIGMLGIGLGYPGLPHVLSRFMAAKDTRTVRKAGMISMVWMVLVYVGAIMFGLFSKAYFGELADPEQALPLAVAEFLPPVLGGFVIAAIVAAICSTADSQLIVVSSTISRDVIPQLMPDKHNNSSERERFVRMLRYDRLALIAIAILSVIFAMTENRVIFDFVLYSWSALGACFGPLVILGLMWKKTTKQGAIAGMVVGLVVTIIWHNTAMLKDAVYELVPAFILAFAAVWLVSLMTQPARDHA